jgi:hypothetical protein
MIFVNWDTGELLRKFLVYYFTSFLHYLILYVYSALNKGYTIQAENIEVSYYRMHFRNKRRISRQNLDCYDVDFFAVMFCHDNC